MTCNQAEICYYEDADNSDIREQLKTEILNLTDAQAEYVLRRIQENNV